MKGQCFIFHLLSWLYGGLRVVLTTGSPSYQRGLLLSSAESHYHRTVLCVCVCVCVLDRSAEHRSQQLGETAPTGAVPGRMCLVFRVPYTAACWTCVLDNTLLLLLFL